MKSSTAKPQFVLLFTSVMLIAHALAELPEDVERRLIASRRRYHEARLSFDDETDAEWAGAIQLQPPDTPFDSITADWTLFDPKPPGGSLQPNELYEASLWIGFDGAAASVCKDRVIQAGVNHWFITDANGQFEQSGTTAVVEWFPEDPIFLRNYIVNPSDRVVVTVHLDGPTQATATFETPDNSAPSYRFSFWPSSNTQFPACGLSAEWIFEVPSLPFSPMFGSVDMNGCAADQGGQVVNLDGAIFDNIYYNGLQVVGSTQASLTTVNFRYTGIP